MRIKNLQKHCGIFAREEKVNIISRNLSKEHLLSLMNLWFIEEVEDIT